MIFHPHVVKKSLGDRVLLIKSVGDRSVSHRSPMHSKPDSGWVGSQNNLVLDDLVAAPTPSEMITEVNFHGGSSSLSPWLK